MRPAARVSLSMSAFAAAVACAASVVSAPPAAAAAPVLGNGQSIHLSASKDGRYVAFSSGADNLVAGDTNGRWDVFVRDTATNTTRLVSRSQAGALGNGDSEAPSISSDGRYVAFSSYASNLIKGDTNGTQDAFRVDTTTGAVQRINVTASGGQIANGLAHMEGMSGDGRYVLYQTWAALVPGDTNGVDDIYMRDVVAGTNRRISISPTGAQFKGDALGASISPNGRWVGWMILRPGNGVYDAYRWDRTTGKTTLVWQSKFINNNTQFEQVAQVIATNGGVSYATCLHDLTFDESWMWVYAVAAPATLSFRSSMAPCWNGAGVSGFGAMVLMQEGDDISLFPGPGLLLYDKTGPLKRLPAVTTSVENTLSTDGKVALWSDGMQLYRWVIATGVVEPVSAANGT